LLVEGIRLIDPILLFKGKCHNLVHLPQYGRQDLRHVQILQIILPFHFGRLLDLCKQGSISERTLLNEIKLLTEFEKDKWVRKALGILDTSLLKILPLEDLAQSGLPKVQRFAASLISGGESHQSEPD